MEHYGIITTTHMSRNAITTTVLPNYKLKKVSVFRIYFPGMKSEECAGITDFENYYTCQHSCVAQAEEPNRSHSQLFFLAAITNSWSSNAYRQSPMADDAREPQAALTAILSRNPIVA